MSDSEPELGFLRILGVEAQLIPDPAYGKLVKIETAAYELHQPQIDQVLKHIKIIANNSYFQLRSLT